MASGRLINPFIRYVDDNGVPLSGGLVYFYEAGSTTTLKDTYSDVELTIPNTNPVILSSAGIMPNVFVNGSYRVVVKDKNGVQIVVRDYVNIEENFPNDYISPSGLYTSANASTPLSKIDIQPGEATDSTNTIMMLLSDSITKSTSLWQPGDDVGGMAVPVANNTWYYIFLVMIDGAFDIIFDSNSACASGISSYGVQYYRVIGFFKTNGSAEIIKFGQRSNYWWWDVPVRDVNNASPGSSANLATLTIPPALGTAVEQNKMFTADLAIKLTGEANQTCCMIVNSTYQTNSAASATTNFSIIADSTAVGVTPISTISTQVVADVLSQIRYRVTASGSAAVDMLTKGWFFTR